ncbi:Crp/Fnr family transcriptional regulator, partial [Klebsiella pneumoniae]|uniref:Crp/Fnr family transcriptional regulator n=1 Tax=Klebsiella pneumoniae TaxID=573 RepID=UPI0015E120B1
MAGVSSDAANDLVASAELVTFEPLETIFLEGQQARVFFCLLSGYVRFFKRAQSGRTADIRIYEPGDVFAECMLTADSTYRHSAQAVDKTKVARFDIASVRNLATKHPSIDKMIMNVMSRHLI